MPGGAAAKERWERTCKQTMRRIRWAAEECDKMLQGPWSTRERTPNEKLVIAWHTLALMHCRAIISAVESSQPAAGWVLLRAMIAAYIKGIWARSAVITDNTKTDDVDSWAEKAVDPILTRNGKPEWVTKAPRWDRDLIKYTKMLVETKTGYRKRLKPGQKLQNGQERARLTVRELIHTLGHLNLEAAELMWHPVMGWGTHGVELGMAMAPAVKACDFMGTTVMSLMMALSPEVDEGPIKQSRLDRLRQLDRVWVQASKEFHEAMLKRPMTEEERHEVEKAEEMRKRLKTE